MAKSQQNHFYKHLVLIKMLKMKAKGLGVTPVIHACLACLRFCVQCQYNKEKKGRGRKNQKREYMNLK
jgi:hypothetical protein